MVSAKALLALYAISGIVNSYPIHRPIEGSSESLHLTTRAPNPRFRNPFDVDGYLKNLDYEIPNNKDIQEWVKEARKKGALAASGNFSGDDDKDDEEEDHDDDHDDDDEDQHSNKATPRESGEVDDDEDEDDHDHDQHTTQSATRPDDERHDADDDDDDDDDEKDHENLNGNGVTQPIQSGKSSSSTSTHGSSIPTATLTTAAAPIPSHNQEGDEGNNIEIMQPVQSVQPSQPTKAQASSAPTTTPSSTAPSIDAPDQQPNDENEDETNQVMQPNNAQGSATPTTPSNTINGGDDAAAPPAVQTVYVPVNIFPTRFPDFPDIDDDEKPSPSSTPLPIFPPPEDSTKTNLPPAALPPSTEENTNIHGPEVSDAPVAEHAPTTTDVTTSPDVADAPIEEQPSDNVDSTTSTYTPRPQMPSHEAQLSKISELLDMVTPKDESEPSY